MYDKLKCAIINKNLIGVVNLCLAFPAKIIEKFGLKKPIYEPTASYGHVGRTPYKESVTLVRNGVKTTEYVQFFGWELLDSVDMIKAAFGL